MVSKQTPVAHQSRQFKPKSTQLTSLQKAVLKNAGLSHIPDKIEKKPDPYQPRFIYNLYAEDDPTKRLGIVNFPATVDDRFFGAFEIVHLGAGGRPHLLPTTFPRELPAFPAIPAGQTQPGDPNFGLFHRYRRYRSILGKKGINST